MSDVSSQPNRREMSKRDHLRHSITSTKNKTSIVSFTKRNQIEPCSKSVTCGNRLSNLAYKSFPKDPALHNIILTDFRSNLSTMGSSAKKATVGSPIFKVST
jgi:hypothetical protein